MRGFVDTAIDVEPDIEEESSPLRQAGGDHPFRILILGNFSGRKSHAGEPMQANRPRLVDPDTLDDVIAALKPSVNVSLADPEQISVPVEFRSLDDFHPDALYRNLPLFRALDSAKQRLASARWRPSPEAAETKANPETVTPPGEGDLLDAILSQQSPAPAAPMENGSPQSKSLSDREWNRMIDRIVAPHISPAQDPRQRAAVQAVNEEIGRKMRAILHDPGFQKVEANWRAIDFLLRRIETSVDLSVHVLDFSYEDLLKDAAPGTPLDNSFLYKLLVHEAGGTIGGRRWNLIIGLYPIAPHAAEFQALTRIAALARKARAAFLSAATPQFLGTDSFENQSDPKQWKGKMEAVAAGLWTDLRHDPASQWIGLAAPRFLLRLPYGKNTSSIDEFDFEEMPGSPVHSDYLWGNPAIACACALVNGSLELTGLPAHTYTADGETEMTPCAEMWFNERAVDRFISAGIMGLASIKNSDSIRVLRLQSINADHPKLGALGEAAAE